VSAPFFFLLGLVLGAAAVWLLARRDRSEIARQIETKLESALPRVAETALRASTEQLHRAAEGDLKLLGQDAAHEMKAMSEKLAAYQERITAFEKERAASQAVIHKQLEAVVGAGAAMTQEARTLRAALATSSGVRGAWGESVLQNILNLCGLNEQIDYSLQMVLPGGLRPDAIIYLPAGRTLAVDAKASLSAFLEGLEAASEQRRTECFADFAKVLRGRAKDLASKDYPAALDRSLPLVVMFVPSEGAFRAALDCDQAIFRYAQELKPPVVLASPTTLFPLLTVIAQGWQQHKAAQQMQELLAEVAELGTRMQTFLGHVQAVGKGLDQAGKAFNAAQASYRSRLAPQVGKLSDLRAGWDEMPELKPAEHPPLLTE